jgi:hypothetical protein
MKVIIKTILAISILMIISFRGYSADTLKLHLTYKHHLDDGGHSKGYTTIRQEFYTPGDELFRNINYNEQSGQIDDYTFYFYTAGKLSSEECYNQKDSLLYILKHTYDASGRENQVIRLVPAGDKLQMTGKTVSTYDSHGKLIRQKAYVGKKPGILTNLSYDQTGRLLEEKRSFKPLAHNPLKNETRLYSYNSDSKISKVSVSGADAAGMTFHKTETYAYDAKGNLNTITVSGPDQKAELTKTYKYMESGVPSLYEESDAAGKVTLILQYDYKKHYMDRGTQVSYFTRGK